jgi:hypothetical protein
MARRIRQSVQQAARALLVARIVAALKKMDWPRRHFFFRRLVRARAGPFPNVVIKGIRTSMGPCELLSGTGTGAAAPDVIILKNKVLRQRLLREFGFVARRR